MKRTTICALVAAAFLGAAGMTWVSKLNKDNSNSQSNNQNTQTQSNYQTIKGKPLSVDGEIFYHTKGSLSIVIEVEGKKVLCFYNTNGVSNIDSLTLSNANALIQSEINDGDDESIELTGTYKGNKFTINSLTANGYTVNFEE